MVILPTFQKRTARYEYDIEMDSRLFHLAFSWNDREESWYMDIMDSKREPIINGIKMVINYNLLLQYRAYRELPQGSMILYDAQQDPVNSQVTFDNFGKRYQLIFLTNEELRAGAVS